MQKRLNGLFLILILSIQLLPVMQMGSIFAQGQLTEEECTVSDDIPNEKESLYSLITTDVHLYAAILTQTNSLVGKEPIDSRHADDIQTPPPNQQ